MKINPEHFPIKQLKNDERAPKKNLQLNKTEKIEDRFVPSNDNKQKIMEENRSASEAAVIDLKKVEDELYNLKQKISKDAYAASEIHQLGDSKVLFLALDQ
jgi:hypothetical protein